MKKKIKLDTPLNINATQLILLLKSFGCFIKDTINDKTSPKLDEMTILAMAHDVVTETVMGVNNLDEING